MSLAKLTSISTQTLSLLLERQRLQTLPSYSVQPPDSSNATPPQSTGLHIPQITQNLNALRSGILALEAKEGRSAAVNLLRNQHERMHAMLGARADDGVESLEPERPPAKLIPSPSPSPAAEPPYTPYTDDPEAAYEPGALLQEQQQMMAHQDTHLDLLSHSINRQRDISLQINDELEVHTGLLEELDTDFNHTETVLTNARRRLDRVAQGAKNNGSTVSIGALILVLLILIIVFKT